MGAWISPQMGVRSKPVTDLRHEWPTCAQGLLPNFRRAVQPSVTFLSVVAGGARGVIASSAAPSQGLVNREATMQWTNLLGQVVLIPHGAKSKQARLI